MRQQIRCVAQPQFHQPHRKVRRFCFLPLPLAGEGRGGGASAHSARRVDRFPPPAALYERVDLPHKRERLSAPPRAISGSHFKQPDTTSHSRGAMCPRFAWTVSLQKNQRAQGRPGARCTRGLVCNVHLKKNAHEHTGSAETLRPSLRNGFTAYIALSPVTGFVATVAPGKR